MCLKYLKCLTPQNMLGALVLICAGILISAYIMENYFDIHPCQMCLYERDVFLTAGGLSLLSFFIVPLQFKPYAVLLMGFIFLFGAGLAGYHVAIQQQWVELPSFCAANDFSAFESIESLKEQLLKTPFVRCDQVTWSLFGLSLAAYNALISLILAFFCGVCFWKR
ncbi:MAG: disulfide bond formation protein B [Alphaproteobacteria bacterium]|nr:disulfide bond formation protein B [Alphaproteobacteria bacterium]